MASLTRTHPQGSQKNTIAIDIREPADVQRGPSAQGATLRTTGAGDVRRRGVRQQPQTTQVPPHV